MTVPLSPTSTMTDDVLRLRALICSAALSLTTTSLLVGCDAPSTSAGSSPTSQPSGQAVDPPGDDDEVERELEVAQQLEAEVAQETPPQGTGVAEVPSTAEVIGRGTGSMVVSCVFDEWCVAIDAVGGTCPDYDWVRGDPDGPDDPRRERPDVRPITDWRPNDGAIRVPDTDPPTTCCYSYVRGCMGGRALVDRDAALLASATRTDTWLAQPPVTGRPAIEDVAEAWTADALAEHASVASFARATMELMALGAPPSLVARTQQASLDEVHHARACFALASLASGEPVGPGPLPLPTNREVDVAAMARWVFVEACVGETIATLVAMRQLRSATVPDVRRALERIIDDEAQHAALGWDTLAWLLEQDPDANQAVVDAALALGEELNAALASAPDDDVSATARAWGRISARERQQAAVDAFEGVVVELM